MSTALIIVAVVICILFRLLNVTSHPQKPVFFCKDLNFLATILKIAPILENPYIPTRLWGFSGHVQTIVHSIIGRVKCPWPIGKRINLILPDNTTLTYDLYQPIDRTYEDDVTIAIVPGICNSSESVYIRTFVHYAQCHGYRCAVLNHVGTLSSVPVTGSRIFTYGHTDDFNEMLHHLMETHSNTKIVAVGYSMGGNIVTKYMGEDRVRPSSLIAGISICQGYDAIKGTSWLLHWQNFRRFYLYAITEAMKSIVLKHRRILLSEDMKKKFKLNERDIVAAATLPELDDAFTRKVHNFRSLTALYSWSSCSNFLNGIDIPMVFINAKDDPIVPEALLEPIREYTSAHDKFIYMEVAHGGHLGFYEGGLIYPNTIAWLDRVLVSLVGSLVFLNCNSTK
uniref:AB hydrolase-1 domain-containing protein n=2 Tax=Clastoptera arizonana TaxID=38151 RepID=A0A1B6CY92_9HEMI